MSSYELLTLLSSHKILPLPPKTPCIKNKMEPTIFKAIGTLKLSPVSSNNCFPEGKPVNFNLYFIIQLLVPNLFDDKLVTSSFIRTE